MSRSGDILVVTSLGFVEQRSLADRYLVPHAVETEIISEGDSARRDGITHFAASAYELVELTIHASPVFTALIGGFALSFGLTLGKFFGKVVESGAGELGKDLYHWFKKLVEGAIRQSKASNLEKRSPEVKPEIRFTLNTVLDEGSAAPVRVRIHISHEFLRWQKDTRTYVDNGVPDAVVLGRVRELFAVILPFTSELLEERRRAGQEPLNDIFIQILLEPGQPDRHKWSVGMGSRVEMGASIGIRPDTDVFIGDDKSLEVRSCADAAGEAQIQRAYQRVLGQWERAGANAPAPRLDCPPGAARAPSRL